MYSIKGNPQDNSPETDISGTNGSAITGKVSGLVDGGLKDRRTELGRKVFVKCT